MINRYNQPQNQAAQRPLPWVCFAARLAAPRLRLMAAKGSISHRAGSRLLADL